MIGTEAPSSTGIVRLRGDIIAPAKEQAPEKDIKTKRCDERDVIKQCDECDTKFKEKNRNKTNKQKHRAEKKKNISSSLLAEVRLFSETKHGYYRHAYTDYTEHKYVPMHRADTQKQMYTVIMYTYTGSSQSIFTVHEHVDEERGWLLALRIFGIISHYYALFFRTDLHQLG